MKTDLNFIQEYLKDKTICLLGNAKSILKFKKNIDKFQIICRCNKGVPTNKEQYIGSRTDVLFISTKVSDYTIKHIFNPKFIIWTTRWGRKKLATSYILNNAIQNLIKDYNELLNLLPKKILPSTGFLALYFLIKHVKFKKLIIYGFDFGKTPTWYTLAVKPNAHHNMLLEKKLIQKLIENIPNVEIIYE
jgi:hypothetical protein